MIETMEAPVEVGLIGEETMEAVETGWHDKLHRICRRINLIKGVLATTKLNNREAHLATKLILEIERSVNNLGHNVTQNSIDESSEWVPSWARIDGQLDDLDLLCEQLAQAIHSPR